MIAFNAWFLKEIESLALKIAFIQRGEDYLQDTDTLMAKLNAELGELAQAHNIFDELPDVAYYAACLKIQGTLRGVVLLDVVARELNVTVTMLQVACLAKYRYRAAGNPKDIEKERELIMSALEAL